MAQYIITTIPNRRTRRAGNARTKYAKVQGGGKFKFVVTPDEATVFNTMASLLQAFGTRCRRLHNSPTSDLTVATVRQAGVQVQEVLNGH